MSPTVSAYIYSRNYANAKTFERFGVHGPYKAGSEMNNYWLLHFDIAMKGFF